MSAHQPELFATDVPPWELDAQGECRAARIVFAEAPHGPLHYRIPDQLLDEIKPGVRVKVPLGRGNREMLGYCIAIDNLQQSPDAFKPVLEVVDLEPLCTPRVLELLQWMSRYYITPLGQVFDAAVPAGVPRFGGQSSTVNALPNRAGW